MIRKPGPEGRYWIDGRPVDPRTAGIGPDDPALQGGVGAFETLAIREGRALDLAAHLERLARAMERLGIRSPSTGHVERTIGDAARAVGLRPGFVRVVITGGGRTLVTCDVLAPDEEGRPSTAVLLPWRRSLRDPLAGIKTLAYAGNLVGLEAARRRGADEGLWLNARGHLAEGCTSNLFVVQRGALYTPGERDGILPGVVRALVLEAARDLGQRVHEGKVRLRRLQQADEAFLTSSVRGLRPLVAFEGRAIGAGRPGPVTWRLSDEVRRRRLAGAGPGLPPGGLDTVNPTTEVES